MQARNLVLEQSHHLHLPKNQGISLKKNPKKPSLQFSLNQGLNQKKNHFHLGEKGRNLLTDQDLPREDTDLVPLEDKDLQGDIDLGPLEEEDHHLNIVDQGPDHPGEGPDPLQGEINIVDEKIN